jgi:8-oxo-dGTP pyrophosphatase MutT (NUDIX family)
MKHYVYLVVWCRQSASTHVLLAKKRFVGSRFNGKKTPPQVLNGARQYCFPGGERNSGERNDVAAFREFHEETAIDFGDQGACARYHVKTIHMKSRDKFSTTYVELNNLESLNALEREISHNIASDTTLDDELELVEVVDKNETQPLFGPKDVDKWLDSDEFTKATFYIGKSCYNPALRISLSLKNELIAKAKKRLNAPHEWHIESLTDLADAQENSLKIQQEQEQAQEPDTLPAQQTQTAVVNQGSPPRVTGPWNVGFARRQCLAYGFAAAGFTLGAIGILIAHIYGPGES